MNFRRVHINYWKCQNLRKSETRYKTFTLILKMKLFSQHNKSFQKNAGTIETKFKNQRSREEERDKS